MIFPGRFIDEFWTRYEIYLLSCREEATARDHFFTLGNKLAESEKAILPKLKKQVLAAQSELAERTEFATTQQKSIMEWIHKPWRSVDRTTLHNCKMRAKRELDQRPKLQCVPAEGFVRHQLDLWEVKDSYREAAEWEIERLVLLDWTPHYDKIFDDCGNVETPKLNSRTRDSLGPDFHWRSWQISS